MGTLIAVDGATLLQDDSNVVCTITPTGVPSIKNKAESKGFLLDGYTVSVSAITSLLPTSTPATIPDPGPYVVAFESTCKEVKENGTLALLEGDLTATISATPKIPVPPPGSPTPYPITFKIEITVAGQTKVKAI